MVLGQQEMNDIMKIVQALEDSNILLKGVTKTNKNKTKTKRRIFRNVIRYIRSQSVTKEQVCYVCMLVGKGIITAGSGNKKRKWILRSVYENRKGNAAIVKRQGQRIVRAVYRGEMDF